MVHMPFAKLCVDKSIGTHAHPIRSTGILASSNALPVTSKIFLSFLTNRRLRMDVRARHVSRRDLQMVSNPILAFLHCFVVSLLLTLALLLANADRGSKDCPTLEGARDYRELFHSCWGAWLSLLMSC